jgi:acyl-CoA synthetase (AMP-forming)/AMP-acid ligase II
MTSSGIFLAYRGPINFQIVESLLLKLKEKSEYADLQTTIRKRTYSLFVECIENICRYSALKGSDEINHQPHISVSDEERRIIISAGNPLAVESMSKLKQRLDNINTLDVQELRKMHETRINSEPVKGATGAGLGFISMALKSGNELSYSFTPLISGFLYFEIQISLNK